MSDNKEQLKPKNFKLPEKLSDKAGYIAWHDRTTLTAMVVDGLTDKVSKWEKANGPITDAMIKKLKKD